MDSLKSLTAYVPDWIDRLDELSGKIEQRQIELARLEADTKDAKNAKDAKDTDDSGAKLTRSKSLRNKGSTESLRPTDDPKRSATPEPEVDAEADVNVNVKADVLALPEPPQMTAAMRRALRKKRRTESLASLDDGDGDHENSRRKQNRTRSMIIVYYDSYVQTFFEDLVKFVSAQRNMMRKAKMAAKVAQIKRMAELEMPDDDAEEGEGEGADELTPDIDFSKKFATQPKAGTPGMQPSSDAIAVDTRAEARIEVDVSGSAADTIEVDTADRIQVGHGAAAIPSAYALNYRTSAILAGTSYGNGSGTGIGSRPMFMRASGRQAYLPTTIASSSSSRGFTGSYLSKVKPPPDIFDELDKNLEYVQSTSEHAAHQFLRDGDCNDEIDNVKQRLVEIRKQAAAEMERLKLEDPEALREEPVKSRSFRPQTMRKAEPKVKATAKETKEVKEVKDVKEFKSAVLPVETENKLEVDEDEGIEVDVAPMVKV